MRPPAGLTAAGRQLWRDLAEAYSPLTPADGPLVDEICRVADRLTDLDRLLRGKGGEWITFKRANETGRIAVVVDRLLAEARAQALALRALLSELRQAHGAAVPTGLPAPSPVETPQPEEPTSAVTDLTARIRNRLTGPSAS